MTPSLTAVVEGVRTGALDFVLLKPADAQFLAPDDFAWTPILEPLAAYKDQLLVLSGIKANWNWRRPLLRPASLLL